MTDQVKHPARFSDEVLPIIARMLGDAPDVLDPFAGVGKIHEIRKYGYKGKIVCNELEPEWMLQAEGLVDEVHVCDAQNMSWAETGRFAAVATSPAYGNRMADHHEAKDSSRRITYRHYLKRPLTPGNSGMLQWGSQYRALHQQVWKECVRVLKPAGKSTRCVCGYEAPHGTHEERENCWSIHSQGLMILNVSDHVRKGEVMMVTAWHIQALKRLGFEVVEHVEVGTKRMRFGENHQARVDHESVVLLHHVGQS